MATPRQALLQEFCFCMPLRSGVLLVSAIGCLVAIINLTVQDDFIIRTTTLDLLKWSASLIFCFIGFIGAYKFNVLYSQNDEHIESILSHAKIQDEVWFKVKISGQPSTDKDWFKESGLNGADELLAEYWKHPVDQSDMWK
eukprot:369890_1